MLPQTLSDEAYWQEYYPQPAEYWQPVLSIIAGRHLGGMAGWRRARLGRNIVFSSDTHVIKIGPPGWAGNMPREAAALQQVAGSLPIRVPEVVAVGMLDAWEYLIERCMPGENLHALWTTLDAAQQASLAVQHGQILAALHALPVTADARAALAFDWQALIDDQVRALAGELRQAGVPEALVASAEAYVQPALPELRTMARPVLLHGDLTHLNLLVQPQGQGWRIDSVIDWGDARIGPAAHEFISPLVHMYRGFPAARDAFFHACGPAAQAVADRRALFARIVLTYAEDFGLYCKELPHPCADWHCVAGWIAGERAEQ